MFNQQVFDLSYDRIVKESPIPQIFAQSLHNSTGYGPMSVSAVPKIRAPVPQFDPFRSPQLMAVPTQQSISEIFNSLKNNASKSRDKTGDVSLVNDSFNSTSGSDNRNLVTTSKQPLGNCLDNAIGNSLCRDRTYHRGRKPHKGQPWQHDEYVENQAPFIASKVPTNGDTFIEDASIVNDDAGLFDSTDDIVTENLYSWIIKPVPEASAICVDGKKSLTDTSFWHSGIITRRISEKLVETASGSVYKLEGHMECLDAMHAGIPRHLAEAFWLGFPEDWDTLVRDFYNSKDANTTVEEDESNSEDEIVTLEEEDIDPGDSTIQESLIDQDENTCTADEGELTEEMDKVEEPVKQKVKDTKKNAKHEETVIENWIIKSVPSRKGIYIVGNKPNGRMWHSNVIEKRLDNRRLKSTSGAVYKLKGSMNKLLALNSGLPLELINKFKKGFPKDWQELVQEYLVQHDQSKRNRKKTKQPKVTRTEKEHDSSSDFKSEGSRFKRCGSKIKLHKPSVNQTKESSTKQRYGKDSRSGGKSQNKLSRSKQKIIKLDEPKKIVITPRGELVDLNTLGRSRSGRLIKPPLQWWTGQVLVRKGEDFVAKAPTKASSQFLEQFEEDFKSSRGKIKTFWNPREKDKDYSISFKSSTANSSLATVVNSEKESLDAKVDQGEVRNQAVIEAAAKQLRKGQETTEVVVSNSNRKNRKSNHANESNDNQTSDESDVSRLKLEVRVILEQAKLNRKKVPQRNTCYKLVEKSNESDDGVQDPFYLDTCEENREDRRTTRSSIGKKREKSDNAKNDSDKKDTTQENVISSSTLDISEDIDKTLTEDSVETTRNVSSRTRSSDSKAKSTKTVEKANSVFQKRPRSCKGKPLVVIEEDSDTRYEEDEVKQKRHMKRKRNNSKDMTEDCHERRKSLNCSSSNVSSDDHWTKEEKDRLHEACCSYNPTSILYWYKIADHVRTKSVESCKKMFFQEDGKPRSEKKKKVQEKPKATSLTANVGTLKRKQQLKDLIEQHNEDYTDDLFDSTPFKATKNKMGPLLEDDEGDSVFEELARNQGKSRFETPKGPDMGTTWNKPPAASSKKTPISRIDDDMLNKKKDVDGYVHRLMKKRLKNKAKKKAVAPLPVKKAPVVDEGLQKKLFKEYLASRAPDNKENYVDSEHEEDYYWEEDQQDVTN